MDYKENQPESYASRSRWEPLVAVDGPLGWLADRTVMSPTLTRLVMAARAPHRRLSHDLDHFLDHPHPNGEPMAWFTNVIPQVCPTTSTSNTSTAPPTAAKTPSACSPPSRWTAATPTSDPGPPLPKPSACRAPCEPGPHRPARRACASPQRSGKPASTGPSKTSPAVTTARSKPKSAIAPTKSGGSTNGPASGAQATRHDSQPLAVT